MCRYRIRLPIRATHRAQTARVAEVLAALPEPQRRLLQLVYVFGYSHAEAAAIIGTSEGAVKTSVWRARAAFRNEYEREEEPTVTAKPRPEGAES